MSFFSKKVVVVTGGSAGLGKHIANAFAQCDSRVVISARGEEQLRTTSDQLRSAGGDVTARVMDVTDGQSVESFFSGISNDFGQLDVLVNNVGKSARGRAVDTNPDEFRQLWELNFLSLVRCTQAALPHLISSRGHLVNIGSLSSKVATSYLAGYPSSKFAVAAYSQQLRFELRDQGVHVLLVCPGPLARDDAGQRYGDQAKDLPESATRPGGGAKLNAIDPSRLADQIVRSCEKRQPELIVPAKAKWLFGISQIWPSMGDWIVRKKTF